MNVVKSLVMNTLAEYERGAPVDWNVAELAIYLVFIFGEINKCKSLAHLRIFVRSS